LNDDPAFGHADLSNCERELIHLAGCIQPHGVLLVLHGPELRIVQISENAQAVLGRQGEGLLHQPLADVDAALAAQVAALTDADIGEPLSLPAPCAIDVNGRIVDFNVSVHRRQACRVLELEPRVSEPDAQFAELDPQVLMQHMSESVARLSGATTVPALADVVVRRLRDLTGYDRVMVYRFDPDGHGKVVAEARDPRLETLMGHHYPSTDIPQRARDLYLLNRVRVLVDVNAAAAALLPRNVPELGGELDMSHCRLRSMSPLHLQYLRNMGVTATLVVSLVREGQLWGLVACHHYRPRRLSAPLWAAVDLLGELIATRITAIESYAHAQVAVQVRRLEQRLLEATSTEGDWRMALFRNPAALLQPVDADGAVLMYDGELLTAGEVPSTPELRMLLRWLQTRVSEGQLADGLFSCASVVRADPGLAALTPHAAGVLAVPLSAAPGDLLVWLRKEQLQSITWAGDPHKPMVGNDPLTLSPRRSFAAWSEIVRDTARPWSDGEQALARAFGRSLADIIIQVNCVRLLIADHQLRHTRTRVADVRKALLVVDERLRVLFASPSLFEMAGHELQPAHELDALAPVLGDVASLRTCLAQLAEDRRGRSQGWALRTPTGESLEVALRVEVVPDRNGSVLGHFMVFDDLGDVRRANEARQRLNTVLERSLQRAPDAPGDANVTPDPLLGAMLASAHMAAMDVADAGSLSAVGRLLEDVDASTRRATQLYERLRRFGAPD
jgi:two-component system, chemotaxis family, sensor kinase Cph1